MNKKDMTVLEHILELRKRLVFILIFFIIAFGAGIFLARPAILYLQDSKEAAHLHLNVFRVTDPIVIYLEMAFVIACIITFPIILYQVWAFVSPGLLEKERKVTLSYIPLAIVLFLAGIAFAYFILFPYVLLFTTKVSEQINVNQVIGINEFFHFLYQLTLPFGFLFQLPVIILFLTRLEIITPQFLKRVRKYAYFVLLIVAALITPPDVISQVIVVLPLIALYEISIWIAKIGYRKKMKNQQDAKKPFHSA